MIEYYNASEVARLLGYAEHQSVMLRVEQGLPPDPDAWVMLRGGRKIPLWEKSKLDNFLPNWERPVSGRKAAEKDKLIDDEEIYRRVNEMVAGLLDKREN